MQAILAKTIGRGMRSSAKKSVGRAMTFKEMREQERIAETAMQAPGAYEVGKSFGSEVKPTINFGRKYEFKPQEGPYPGQYEVDSS